MNRSLTNRILLMVYSAVILLGGCFPEDSLDWSADGSVGLLRTNEALYLVNGQTGELTLIEAENVAPWPDISRDGNWIVYSTEATCATLAEGRRALPASQVKMIENDAKSMREKILSGAVTVTDFNATSQGAFGYSDPYRSWVIRTMCENADEALARELGDQLLQQGRELALECSRLIVVSRADLSDKKIVTTSALGLLSPRFSPDGRYVAYLTTGRQDDDQAHLFVAWPQQNISAVHVASRVALGFAWRPDSQAIAYSQQEADNAIVAVIFEQQICDDDGKLLAEISTDASVNPLEMHRSTGPTKQLVGTLFEQLMRVEYGVGERLFFSSASAHIPLSNIDEPKYLLFCYDFITGAVANVLPPNVSGHVGSTVNFFSLSPDGRRVLLPMEKNRFAIFELGADSPNMPIPEAEEFGQSLPTLVPRWKGNDHISCLVSESSHFLVSDQEQPRERKEIVILSATGDYESTLSENWPDEAIP